MKYFIAKHGSVRSASAPFRSDQSVFLDFHVLINFARKPVFLWGLGLFLDIGRFKCFRTLTVYCIDPMFLFFTKEGQSQRRLLIGRFSAWTVRAQITVQTIVLLQQKIVVALSSVGFFLHSCKLRTNQETVSQTRVCCITESSWKNFGPVKR